MPRKIEISGGSIQINYLPNSCPICHTKIEPILTKAGYKKHDNSYEICLQCSSRSCNSLFIALYQPGHGRYEFQSSWPQRPEKVNLPEEIGSISPKFVEIYNQAITAESYGLDEIAGGGFRKSLEFLIKDYCCSKSPENIENIQKKFLGNVIKEDIDNPRLQSVAEKATWLGNDHSHYIRKFVNEDLLSMKNFIKATVHWIEMEIITDRELKK